MIANPSTMATTVTNRQKTTTRMALLRLLAAMRSRKVCGMACDGDRQFTVGRIGNPSYQSSDQNLTCGAFCTAAASAASSLKNSEGRKPNMPPTTLAGNVCKDVLYCDTTSL